MKFDSRTAATGIVIAILLAGCQKSSPTVNAQEPGPAPAESAAAAKTPDITPLPPAEEKRLTDMAKSRRAADGSTVWDVLQYAEQQRPGLFKVATVDVDYARDSTPTAVSVCYWIGGKRLDSDQDCKTIGWQIAPDKASLAPYQVAATQALEAGREAFVRNIDQMAEKVCGGGKAC
jgi:hypothetical protein